MPITIYSRRADSVEVVSIIGRFTVGEDQHDFRLRTREILGRNVDLLRLTRLNSLFETFDSEIDA